MTFNDIDINCLYLEWHPKVKEFITGFKKEDLCRLLENTETSLFSQQKFNQALVLYTQIQLGVKNSRLAQEARFKVAKTSYYKGDFDWAETQLKVLKS